MISKSEFALLKSSYLMRRIERRSGMTQAEINQAVGDRAIATISRMKELNIQFPTAVGNVQIVSTTETLRHYRATRTFSGKAIGSSDRIHFTVLVSVAIEQDNRLWQHVSFARQDRKIPTYPDIAFIKDCFFPEGWAIQVFPRPEHHVSDHDSCLHLWGCLEHDLLPDFRKFETI